MRAALQNLTSGGGEPQRNEVAGRATFVWEPTDELSAKLRIEGGNYDTDGRQIEIFGETPTTAGPILGLTYSQALAGAPLPLLLYPTGLPQGTSTTASNNVIDYRRSSNGDSSDLSNLEVALTLDYALGNGLTLTSVTGFSTYDLEERCDCDFVGATVFNAGITENYDQVSQELRLASPVGQRVSWVAGVFFQDYGLDEADYLYVPTTSLVVPVLARSICANPALGARPLRARHRKLLRHGRKSPGFTQDSTLCLSSDRSPSMPRTSLTFTVAVVTATKARTARASRSSPAARRPCAATALLPCSRRCSHHPAQVLRAPVSDRASRPGHSAYASQTNLIYLSWARGYSPVATTRARQASRGGGQSLTSGPSSSAREATTYELGLKSALAASARSRGGVLHRVQRSADQRFEGAIGFNVAVAAPR